MRTLICKGIRAFIVVESRLFLLGVEVFSLWDSTSSLFERGEQGFSLQRRSTFNVRDSQNHPCARISILGFQGVLGNERQRPLIKGPYCVLQRWAFNKRWIISTSTHQFQSGRLDRLIFYPLQLPPSPQGSVSLEQRNHGVTTLR